MATSRRVGNYSTSARAVVQNSDAIFSAAMDSKPDFTKISKEAIKGRSLERRAVTKAEGEVAAAGIRAARDVKGYGYKADAIRSEGERKGKKARMAGALGALGSLAGGFAINKFRKEDAKAADERDAKFESLIERTKSAFDSALESNKPGERPKPPTYIKPDLLDYDSSGGSSSSTDDSGVSKTGTSTVPATYKSKPLAGSSDISKLTDDDFKHLAYAISSEAGPGKDRYGVAASILNRVASDKWPGTVKDVIFQDGQYEGVYKGKSTWDSGIEADLSSDKGRSEILKALEVLDGRTDFKGQTMLKYRSNKGNKGGMMDPMFDLKGNFFHYSHQT